MDGNRDGMDGNSSKLNFTEQDQAGAPGYSSGKLHQGLKAGERAKQALRFEKTAADKAPAGKPGAGKTASGKTACSTEGYAKNRHGKPGQGQTGRGESGTSGKARSNRTFYKNARHSAASAKTADASASAVRGRSPARAAAAVPVDVASGAIHRQVSKAGDDDIGVKALNETEMGAETAARSVENAVYSRKLRYGDKAEKLVHGSGEAEKKLSGQKYALGTRRNTNVTKETAANPLSRWMQRRQIRKKYAEANRAARTGAVSLAGKTGRNGKAALSSIKKAVSAGSSKWKIVLIAILAAVMIFIIMFQSCSVIGGGVMSVLTSTSWPASDSAITKAEAYYTKMEAELQKQINGIESEYPGYDEYNYNIGDISHDPTALISYLCATRGNFLFAGVKSELEELFDLQYQLDVETGEETRTVTKTVRQGDYIGEVVTSGYCNCSICCGKWAGGATASGVYPTASHTIAVDAYNPIVPLGTQVIMNGTLYTVEDTGDLNKYGVNFDVYYDDHPTALTHGHKTWAAYYAGGNGEEVEVTTTETVTFCNVTLTANDFSSLLLSRMSDDETEIYNIYNELRGNRVMYSSPVNYNWRYFISGDYGWRCNGTSVEESDCLDISVPEGTEVLSVLDGTIESVGKGTLSLSDDTGCVFTFGGLKSISVSAGEEVTAGQTIAKVGSAGTLTVSFSYKGNELNPYFYLDSGTGSIYENSGDVSEKAGLLIDKAYQYLGVPYVWGGYSPSGFDCSGFVSYCINNCGAGWSYGRLTANGLLGICTTIPASEAQPGDLIFFQGTYSVSGASHVGIYLGNGQMIHAGSPVQVSNITSSYYQKHFYCYGRLPGM